MNESTPDCWVLIPVKAPGAGKTRLAGVLDERERARLVADMLNQVVTAAQSCPAVTQVCILGSADHGVSDTLLLADSGGGLNQALTFAVRNLAQRGDALHRESYGIRPLNDDLRDRSDRSPDRVIIVAADLPQLSPVDLKLLAQVPANAIAIAPDRHGTGTNALSLPRRCLADFQFRFGAGSFAAHRREAHRLRCTLETLLSPGLEKDIDEPADLSDCSHCWP